MKTVELFRPRHNDEKTVQKASTLTGQALQPVPTGRTRDFLKKHLKQIQKNSYIRLHVVHPVVIFI